MAGRVLHPSRAGFAAAPLNADNLYFIGTGDSAGNLTLNTNWGVDGSDPVANKTPTVFDDLFFDSRFDRTSSTVSIDWIGFQEVKSVTVKSDYCGVASASSGLLQFKQWNGGIENPGFIVRGVFAVEGSKVFGPSETLYPLSESGAANYLGNEVRILSHGGSSGYARNLSFVAGSVVVGGNPDGGNAKLYVGGTSRYDGLKSFTVGSLTGGGISIDATCGNAQLNLAVQGSGEESAAGNPAAKIYGAVSMVSSGNYKSQFVLFNNESVFSLPVADRFSTLQSYSDAERRANVEVGGLRSSGAKTEFEISASAELDFLYEVAVIDGDFGFETDSDGLVRGIDVSADNGWKADLYFNPDDRILRVMYTVPEPAAIAAVLGAFALLLAARRER